MDLENPSCENEVCPASMDLNDFAMPSDEGSTESENSANEGSDSSCDYEFLQTNSTVDPVLSDVRLGEETSLIANSLEMLDDETDSSDLNVVSFEEVPKSTTPSEFGTSDYDKSHILDDWHLVSQTVDKYDVSDDDSIVILEREVARPCYTLTKVDSQTGADGQNVLMTTSLITADKHVQTIDEVDSEPTLELQPIEEAALVESSIPVDELNRRPWLVDCLLVGALFASLVCLYYFTDYIIKAFNHPPPRHSAEEANDAVMEFMVHIVRDFNSRIEEIQRNTEYVAENRDENAVSYKPQEINEFFKRDLASITLFFDRYREEGRRLLANNKALYQFMEMVRDNVYILNVHNLILHCPEPTFLPKSMISLLKAVDRMAACDLTMAGDKLPVACFDGDRRVNVIFHRYDLISVNLHAEVFYSKLYRSLEAGAVEDAPPAAGTVAVPEAKGGEAAGAAGSAFVQDCDNFSKHYRPDFCGAESNSAACSAQDRAAVNEEEDVAAKTCARSERPVEVPEPSAFGESGATSGESGPTSGKSGATAEPEAKAMQMVGEFKSLIRKFKADFDHFYSLCVDAEERMELGKTVGTEKPIEAKDSAVKDEESLVADSAAESEESGATAVDQTSEFAAPKDEQPTEEVPVKPLSGDWFFNMTEARAKLRRYYEETISGDWILKLGKARENLRKRFDDYKRMFMKAKEQQEQKQQQQPKQEQKQQQQEQQQQEQQQQQQQQRKNKTKGDKWWSSKRASGWFKDYENLKKDFKNKWSSKFNKVKEDLVRNYNKYAPKNWQFRSKWFYS